MEELCSPVQTNNKGVILLESGNFEDAARLFKKASKSMMAVISQQQLQKKKLVDGPGRDPRSAHPPRPSEEMHSPNEPTENQSPKTKGVPQPSNGACEQPRKRRRRGTLTSSFPVPTYNLGRPLWIQSKEKRKDPLDSASLSATLLYNLGLAFNLMACKNPKEEAEPFYRRALELYAMSSEIMLRAPVSNAIASPVFVVALHNMTQIHTVLGEFEEVSKFRSELATVLRLMGSSRGMTEKQYEEFYIKLLSLPKATGMAPAA